MPPRRKVPLVDIYQELCMPGLVIEFEGVPMRTQCPEVGQILMYGLLEAYRTLSGKELSCDEDTFIRECIVVTEVDRQKRYLRFAVKQNPPL